jgi:hypothetical protein
LYIKCHVKSLSYIFDNFPLITCPFFLLFLQKKTSPLTNTLRTVLSFRPKRDVPFHTKINLLWTAPITKFWLTQVFYFAFLGIFCLATLWPTCGNQVLDMILWFWAAVIEMELVCRVYRKYHVSFAVYYYYYY